MADELYQKLTSNESVHLEDWLSAGHVDQLQIDAMESTRLLVNFGLAYRAQEGIKVRQPLASGEIEIGGEARSIQFTDDHLEIIKDELNIKDITTRVNDNKGLQFALSIRLNTNITPELKREGLMREVVRHVQNARKTAGLNVDDRIELSLKTNDTEIKKATDEYQDAIKTETLTTSLGGVLDGFEMTVKVDGAELNISLKKHI